MPGNISAIPTKYNGVQFRSRLEAKWAAFFDLCGWQREYEPFDFAGYIPDFLLKFAQPTLVDVKPITEENEIVYRQAQVVQSVADWIAGPLEEELRVLDAAPDTDDDLQRIDDLAADIEYVRERRMNPWRRVSTRRAFVVGSQLLSSIWGDTGETHHYLTIDGDQYCPLFPCVTHVGVGVGWGDCLVCGAANNSWKAGDVLTLWRSASNAVQWKPPA